MELIYTILGIILLAILVVGAFLLKRFAKTNAAAKLQEVFDYRALSDLIFEALPWLITKAEQLLGGKTGAVKKAYVIQEAMKLLPDGLRAHLSINEIEQAIETVLVQLEPLWEKVPALIGKPETDTENE